MCCHELVSWPEKLMDEASCTRGAAIHKHLRIKNNRMSSRESHPTPPQGPVVTPKESQSAARTERRQRGTECDEHMRSRKVRFYQIRPSDFGGRGPHKPIRQKDAAKSQGRCACKCTRSWRSRRARPRPKMPVAPVP